MKRAHKVRSRAKRIRQSRKNNPPARGIKPTLQENNRQVLSGVLRRLNA